MTSFEWQVPILVVLIIAGILYFSGRPEALKRPTRKQPTTGRELIERLGETIGIAIVVESVEASAPPDTRGSAEPDVAGATDVPHSIHATLLFGRYTAAVVASGPTESDAWGELAKIAIAWRNSDYQHIQMWPGGA
jgi:hypothetical protein